MPECGQRHGYSRKCQQHAQMLQTRQLTLPCLVCCCHLPAHHCQPSGYWTLQHEYNQIKFEVPLRDESGYVNNTKTEYKYKFDGLLPMDVSQDAVFDTVAKPAVLRLVGGHTHTHTTLYTTPTHCTHKHTRPCHPHAMSSLSLPLSLTLVPATLSAPQRHGWLQCDSVCIWPDWLRQDIHHHWRR